MGFKTSGNPNNSQKQVTWGFQYIISGKPNNSHIRCQCIRTFKRQPMTCNIWLLCIMTSERKPMALNNIKLQCIRKSERQQMMSLVHLENGMSANDSQQNKCNRSKFMRPLCNSSLQMCFHLFLVLFHSYGGLFGWQVLCNVSLLEWTIGRYDMASLACIMLDLACGLCLKNINLIILEWFNKCDNSDLVHYLMDTLELNSFTNFRV